MARELKIEVKENGNIQLKLMWRSPWGAIVKRMSFTISNRQFEKALKDARITVPWERVMSR